MSKKKPQPAPKQERLTQKQALFVEAYIGKANGNATEAARMAGYAQPHSQGPRLLENVEIAARVSARVSAAAMGADEVLAELTAIARADWREFVKIDYDKNGEILDATLLLKDKLKALELLGKHHKLFTDKHEHSGEIGGAAPVLNVILNSK